MSSLANFLSHKAYLGINLHKAYFAKDKELLKKEVIEIDEAIYALDAFINAFEYQWKRENKPFGYEIHCARFGGVKERLRYAKEVAESYIKGDIDSIEELEAKQLPFYRPEGFRMNNYRSFISTSEM